MNDVSKSIGWAERTWNPVTGCPGPGGTPEHPRWCPYCYARRLANGRLRKLYLSNPNVAPGYDPDDPFSPRFWPKRFDEPARRRKPSRIFVADMGDLFFADLGRLSEPWWEAYKAIGRTMRSPFAGLHHTYMMLTKNPQNIPSHADVPWNDNEWLGITVTCQKDWDKRWPILRQVNARVKFVSFEPLLGSVDMGYGVMPDWIIIGAQTRPDKQPAFPWVKELTTWADGAGTPIFLKRNLACEAMGIQRRQEFPK